MNVPVVADDPDLRVDIEQLIDEVVPDPGEWRRSPNPALGGRRPEELIGAPDESVLRDVLRAAKHGTAS